MTPAERIAAEIIRSHYRRLDGSGASYSLADEAIDALMDGHDDVHLHRHPDGTITAVPMRLSTSFLRMRARLGTTPHLHSTVVAGCYRCELTELEKP